MVSKRKLILLLLMICATSYNPIALETAIAPDYLLVPENVRIINGYSESDSFKSVEKTVTSFMRKWSLKGASVAIAKDGKLLYAKGFGVTDTVSWQSVQPYNRFRVASISKLITAVAIMKLHEEGKVDMDDKIFGPTAILNDTYFSHPADKRAYSITVEDLLRHEGGWSQRFGDQMFMPITVADKLGLKPPVDTRDIVRFALDKKLHFTPGKGRSYSNLGYGILGLVVEKVSGMSYEDYCKKHILEPMGIFDMELAHNLPDEKAPFEVTYYTPPDIVLKPSIYGTNEMVFPSYGGNDIESLGGAGAWIATAPDLMRLLLSIDGFDSFPDFLSRESVDYMTNKVAGTSPVGWLSATSNGTWMRTGSFPGSSGVMKRQQDGMAWVILFNTSAWNGPQVHSYVNATMSKVLRQVKEWPETDLYDHYLAVPLMADIVVIQ